MIKIITKNFIELFFEYPYLVQTINDDLQNADLRRFPRQNISDLPTGILNKLVCKELGVFQKPLHQIRDCPTSSSPWPENSG